jgi:DNA-binding transcriptional LysR family regulator
MSDALAGVDLNLLVSLRALLRERSVTRAARAVGLTQPAMSNALRRLRRLLDDELLIRVGNTLELTQRAEQLIAPLQRALVVIDREVLHPGAFDPTTSTRTFTVVASNSTAVTVLPELVRQVSRQAPHVLIRVHPPAIRHTDELLRRPDIDVVLLPDVAPTSRPRERLYDIDWVCVVARDNPEVDGELTLEHLKRLPCAYYISEGMPTHPDLTLQALGAMGQKRLEVEDFLLLPFLLKGTVMVAFLQERVAHRLGAAADIRIFPTPVPVAPLGIDMVWNTRAEGDAGCAWLRDQLVAAAHSLEKYR